MWIMKTWIHKTDNNLVHNKTICLYEDNLPNKTSLLFLAIPLNVAVILIRMGETGFPLRTNNRLQTQEFVCPGKMNRPIEKRSVKGGSGKRIHNKIVATS